MYVATDLNFKLDEIVKSFEVALRSYLADKVTTMFDSAEDFKHALVNLKANQTASSMVLSGKLEAVLKKITADYQNIYLSMEMSAKSLKLKDYSTLSVPYVSELIDLIMIFFSRLNDLNVIKNYQTIEEFLYKCSLYHRVRNDLSHPASKKILKVEASEIMKFISKAVEELDNKYFWYVSKNDILKLIDSYYREETNRVLKFDNLNNISIPHQKTISRETELAKLHDAVFGSNAYSRVAGSTVIYGYGGVGKTALVIDFIYEVIQKMQSADYRGKYDFILFFSSKDEILSRTQTTGEYYIDKINTNIKSYDEILRQILTIMGFEKVEQLQSTEYKGIIVIDNIENLAAEEKEKIFSFMRRLPRNIQFIITSRNEESAEEKLHLSEFKDFTKGKEFIFSYIESNDFDLTLSDEDIQNLLSATKGNTLLLVQSLVSMNDKSTSLQEISSNLSNYESSDFEKVASFMYKNTFDNAIKELELKKMSPKIVILVATLYIEKIDLYALSQLSDLNINEVREIANYLTTKLIFDKTNEFYSVNEFAARFIFISLMPNKIEREKLQNKIDSYKQDLKSKLNGLEQQRLTNEKINRIISDWKPNNYIDQIVITEVFHMYQEFQTAVSKRNNRKIEELLEKYEKYEYTTKHPYIRFQKARILHIFITRAYFVVLKKDEINDEINRCYEDTLESINTSYSYIKNTESHKAVLMLYGLFLCKTLYDYQKGTRYLEDALELQRDESDKKFYIISSALYRYYVKLYDRLKDKNYIKLAEAVYDRVVFGWNEAKVSLFDFEKFKKQHANNVKHMFIEKAY